MASGWSEGKSDEIDSLWEWHTPFLQHALQYLSTRLSASTLCQLKAVEKNKNHLREQTLQKEHPSFLSPPSILRELMVKVWLSRHVTLMGASPGWRLCERPAHFPDSYETRNVKICTSAFRTWVYRFGWFLVPYQQLRNQITLLSARGPSSLTEPLNQTNWGNKYARTLLPWENATLRRHDICFWPGWTYWQLGISETAFDLYWLKEIWNEF